MKKYSKFSEKDLQKLVMRVLEKEKSAAKAYKSGDKKALEFLVGQAQKASGLRTDAKVVQTLIKKKHK